MSATLPLPATTSELLARVPLATRHAGLQLDKFVAPADRPEQKAKSLAEVCQATGDGELLAALLQRRKIYLDAAGAVQWRSETAGPLTMHLARVSALENAGICLHPVYGFVYLPGTGLKGMARAYAETVWLPAQYQVDVGGRPTDAAEREKAAAAWRTIEAVFGSVRRLGQDRRVGQGRSELTGTHDPPRPATEGPPSRSRDVPIAGSIVFHDAWPESWPKLEVDVANNLHSAYYQDRDSRDAPGDWEPPAMDYFLAIGSGNAFCFALSKRDAGVTDELLEQARQWLLEALLHEGAGGKTSAGYGGFRSSFNPEPTATAGEPVPVGAVAVGSGLNERLSPAREIFETTLELVTPAFLAGANQEAADCQLRAATVRGLLRWWWRTMHAGFMEVAELRRLEAAVWGDATIGGAIRVTVQPLGPIMPVLYDYTDRFAPMPGFQREHHLQPPPHKTAQGLFYASYGMDDGGRKRSYLPSGTRWTVRLTARRSRFPAQNARGKGSRTAIPPQLVLQQARAALWLLVHFGGAGSKSRKGFGSFADIVADGVDSIDLCRQTAAAFRQACGCDGQFNDRFADSLSLSRMLPPLEVPTPWKDPWYALDQLGYAFQSFAQLHKHKRMKAALGLPRQIHGPRREGPRGGRPGSHWPPEQLKSPKGERYAAPVFYHLARTGEGGLLVRATAFTAKYLPDAPTSAVVLGDLLAHMDRELRERAAASLPETHTPPTRSAGAPAARGKPADRRVPAHGSGPPSTLPKAGQQVETVLVDDPKGRGRRFASHVKSGLLGPILNADRVPPEKNLGDSLTLLVHSISSDGKQIQWRVPTEADMARATQHRGGPPRGPSRRH